MDKENNIKVSGVTEHRIYDKEGNLIDSFVDNNVVVTIGRLLVAKLIAGDSTDKVTKIGFGTNGTPAQDSDSSLTSPTVKNVDAFTADETGVTFYWSLDYSEGNGVSIQERGLITLGNSLFARKSHAAVVKTADIRIEGSWRINL